MSNRYCWAPARRRTVHAAPLLRLALLMLATNLALLGWAHSASAVVFASKPFADNRPGTQMRDVVVRGSDNHVWLKTFNGTNWNGWLDLGGDVRGRPTSISLAPNHLDVFARDSTNHLMHRWWNGTSFTNWEAIGGAWQFVGDPIPVNWSNDRIDIFARGTDNALLHLYIATGGWSNWESLGGSLGYDPAVDTSGVNNLDIFAVDPNGLLAHKYFFGQWSTWQPLGAWQYTSAPTAATTGLRAGAFARGTDAALDATWWTPAPGWSGPFTLGSPGGIAGQPSAVTFGDPIMAVFARGQADNRLYQNWYNGAYNAWSGWSNVGGPWVMSTDPYAIAWNGSQGKQEEVFAIGNDGSLIHTWFDSSAWHAWENLGPPSTTSSQYGGANKSVDTPSEVQAVLAALAALGWDSADGAALLAGLSPTDSAYVNQQLNPSADPAPVQDPDIPVPPDPGSAGAAHTFYCNWKGQKIGGLTRPLEPYLSSGNIYGIASFVCDENDAGRAVNMRTCIQKWELLNTGLMTWVTVRCDDQTWTGYIGPPTHDRTTYRLCSGGSGGRLYRVVAKMTVYTVWPNALNPIATSTRTSPQIRLPCRAG